MARIYPLYLAIGFLTLPFFIINLEATPSIFSGGRHEEIVQYIQLILSILSFLLMIQAWFPPLFKVWNFGGTWALSVELFFYLLYPFIRKFLNKLSLNYLFCLTLLSYLWASIPIMYACFFSDKPSFSVMNIYSYISPIFRIGEFTFGILIYMLSEERNVLFFKNGFVLFVLICILSGFLTIEQLLPGLSFLSFIAIPSFAWTISWLRNKRISFLESKLLLYAGHISYSFYLAQLFVFGMLKRQIKEANISMASKWFIAFIITVLISILLHHLVEKRFRSYIRNKIS